MMSFGGRRRWPAHADVVDAFEHRHVAHARNGKHVAVEAAQRRLAEDRVGMGKDAIAGDRRVDDGKSAGACQSFGEHIRPAMVAVIGRPRAVGDRVRRR